MTSKLRRTIVGVGIALGGAAPACLGRTEVGGEHPTPSESDEGSDVTVDAGMPDANDARDASDFVDASDPPDASAPLDATSDAAMDAALDAPIDPFCDVSWPPTKGNQFSGPVACVDPLNECANQPPPYRCYRLLEPYVCDERETRVGPLYCIEGEWRCPPGADNGSRCHCFGPLPTGQTCTDAGPM